MSNVYVVWWKMMYNSVPPAKYVQDKWLNYNYMYTQEWQIVMGIWRANKYYNTVFNI